MDLEVWVALMDLEGECVVEMFVLANAATLELASKEYRMGNWRISRQYVSRSCPRGTLSQNWRLFLIILRAESSHSPEKAFVQTENIVREGFKTPSHGKCPLGGYPPHPPGGYGQDFSVKLAKKT